jgi:hypothetical protein
LFTFDFQLGARSVDHSSNSLTTGNLRTRASDFCQNGNGKTSGILERIQLQQLSPAGLSVSFACRLSSTKSPGSSAGNRPKRPRPAMALDVRHSILDVPGTSKRRRPLLLGFCSNSTTNQNSTARSSVGPGDR